MINVYKYSCVHILDTASQLIAMSTSAAQIETKETRIADRRMKVAAIEQLLEPLYATPIEEWESVHANGFVAQANRLHVLLVVLPLEENRKIRRNLVWYRSTEEENKYFLEHSVHLQKANEFVDTQIYAMEDVPTDTLSTNHLLFARSYFVSRQAADHKRYTLVCEALKARGL